MSSITEFTKMHGAGNDFVVFDGRGPISFTPSDAAPYLCDRQFGIGADGIIIVSKSNRADCKMVYLNADGSRSICGNGMRCAAHFARRRGFVPPEAKALTIETDTDVVSVDVLDGDGFYRVKMGQPRFDGPRIPTAVEAEWIDLSLDVSGEQLQVSAVGMGNPHCVLFVDEEGQERVRSLGPLLEHHPFFPQRTNVEFVRVIDDTHVFVRIWERGVGETLACGTGFCAVIAAGVKTGRLSRSIHLRSPGGEFRVEWEESSNTIYLSGPATDVFQGSVSLDELTAKGRPDDV